MVGDNLVRGWRKHRGYDSAAADTRLWATSCRATDKPSANSVSSFFPMFFRADAVLRHDLTHRFEEHPQHSRPTSRTAWLNSIASISSPPAATGASHWRARHLVGDVCRNAVENRSKIEFAKDRRAPSCLVPEGPPHDHFHVPGVPPARARRSRFPFQEACSRSCDKTPLHVS